MHAAEVYFVGAGRELGAGGSEPPGCHFGKLLARALMAASGAVEFPGPEIEE